MASNAALPGLVSLVDLPAFPLVSSALTSAAFRDSTDAEVGTLLYKDAYPVVSALSETLTRSG